MKFRPGTPGYQARRDYLSPGGRQQFWPSHREGSLTPYPADGPDRIILVWFRELM
ncbi:MAG: hypothetical protein GX216_02350 [Methanomicrobiales archaeon]|nr:hypothetical protein [Methanomicrobiales archaeon]